MSFDTLFDLPDITRHPALSLPEHRPIPSPRPYQNDAIGTALTEWAAGIRRPVIQAPTGTGKGLMMAWLAREWRALCDAGTTSHVEDCHRILVIVNRDELVRQTVRNYRWVLPDADIGVVQAQYDDRDADIVICTVQTAHRRIGAMGQFGLVIVDECHHAAASTWRKTIEQGVAPGGMTCGFSATPERADDKPLDGVFDKIVWKMGIVHAIAQGFLVDVRQVNVDIGIKGVKKTRTGHGYDYGDSDLNAAMLEAESPVIIAEALRQLAPDRKSIVFCPTVAVAAEVAAELNDIGLPAGVVVGSTPHDERQAIYKALEAGQLSALVGVAVFTEGFDLPPVDCVVVARPTSSRVLYTQMVGRGLRPFPGKDDCLVINCASPDVKVSSVFDLAASEADEGGADGVGGASPMLEDGTESLLEALERNRELRQKVRERIKLIADAVSVFDEAESEMATAGSGGMRVVEVSKESALVTFFDGDAWQVAEITRGRYNGRRRMPGTVNVIKEGASAAEALALFQQRVERAPKWLTDPNAPWRQKPASPAQMKLVPKDRRHNDMTRGEAGQIISEKLARKALSQNKIKVVE